MLGAQQILLGMPNTTMRGATWDFCATCDFWTLKRDPCIKRYPSGVRPSPARETAPGFSLRGRGAPRKRLGFFGAPTPGAPNTSVFWPPPSRTPNRKTSRGVRRMPPISERPKRKSGRPAAGLAQPRDEHGAEPARFVEALNTPVVAPVMCLFGGLRDSLFINPFKKVTKAPCKFHLLLGACSSPVVGSAPPVPAL